MSATMNEDPVVIVAAARTPVAGLMGELAAWSAPKLGSVAIRAVLERSGIDPEKVEQVLMGNVLQAGQGQGVARQAAVGAGLPNTVSAAAISKVDGSGMQAIMLAYDQLLAGSCAVAIAGGMESMSQAPYLVPQARGGYRLGNGQLLDPVLVDGTLDASYKDEHGQPLPMVVMAEQCVRNYKLSRKDQDAFATASNTRLQAATESGVLAWELAKVKGEGRDRTKVETDELPRKVVMARIPLLNPAVGAEGTITSATTGAHADGAAAVLMMRRSQAETLGLKPIATVLGHANHGQRSEFFTTAPVGAIFKLIGKLDWQPDQVDLWEINEAFAAIPLAVMDELDIPHDKVNVHGGACAMGHPLGASGARVVVSLLGALRAQGKKRGIATVSIGGGEATAIALELVD